MRWALLRLGVVSAASACGYPALPRLESDAAGADAWADAVGADATDETDASKDDAGPGDASPGVVDAAMCELTANPCAAVNLGGVSGDSPSDDIVIVNSGAGAYMVTIAETVSGGGPFISAQVTLEGPSFYGLTLRCLSCSGAEANSFTPGTEQLGVSRSDGAGDTTYSIYVIVTNDSLSCGPWVLRIHGNVGQQAFACL